VGTPIDNQQVTEERSRNVATLPTAKGPRKAPRRWEYRRRIWSDFGEVSVDAALARARAGSPHAGCTAGGGAPAAGSLPCLPREQQHWNPVEKSSRLQRVGRFKWHPRDLRDEHNTRKKLRRVMKLMQDRYGLERLLFVTGTFPDKVMDRKEAYRRFHSFCTNILSKAFECWVLAVGRHLDGAIHYHLLAAAPVGVDVRTGFDFQAAKRRDYRSACSWLRELWRRMRSLTNYDGEHSGHPYPKIGRCEFMPVRKSAGGVAGYVGRYLRNQFGTRFPEDKGARLVRFSRAAQELDDVYWAPIKARVIEIRHRVKTMAQRYGERRRRGVTCSRVEWRPEWERALASVPPPPERGSGSSEDGDPLCPF